MDEENNNKIDWHYQTHDHRAVVYLIWWVIATFGFIATHFYQNKNINGVWFVLTIIGLVAMWRFMPLKIPNMRNIFIVWAVVLLGGMGLSGAVFRVESLEGLIPYLGSVWMLILALGYLLNGLIDKPMFWYIFAFAIHVIGAGLAYYVDPFIEGQYLVAAIMSFWSMGYLWLYRSQFE